MRRRIKKVYQAIALTLTLALTVNLCGCAADKQSSAGKRTEEKALTAEEMDAIIDGSAGVLKPEQAQKVLEARSGETDVLTDGLIDPAQIRTAGTETVMGKAGETLRQGMEVLSETISRKKLSEKDYQKAVSVFATAAREAIDQMADGLEETADGSEEYQEYEEAIQKGIKRLKKSLRALEKGNKKEAEDIISQMEKSLLPEEPVAELADELPFVNIAEDAADTEKYAEGQAEDYNPTQDAYSDKNLEAAGGTVINDVVRDGFREDESVLELYEHVRNTIKMEFYYGARKGAIGTYEQGAGNDYDIASLFIGILRDRKIPARYVRGEIEITAGQALEWTAAEDISSAMKVMSAQGIPVTGMVSRERTVAVRLEHVWAEAYVPYTDYRGAGKRSGDSLWIALDPGFKEMEHMEGVELEGLQDYVSDDRNVITEGTQINGVDASSLAGYVERADSAFLRYLLENGYGGGDMTDVFGGSRIIQG